METLWWIRQACDQEDEKEEDAVLKPGRDSTMWLGGAVVVNADSIGLGDDWGVARLVT